MFESRRAWGRGTLFRLWRRVASWSASSRKKSGAQHRGSGKRFECGVHGALTNIWACTVKGPRKASILNGYLIDPEYSIIANIPPDNIYLMLEP
ncbi:conjugal transfer nickase/helicase domain-containing protein [Pseudomonas putida]|uniref:conjugal transfer nickase/helicase domain-containing protein n=1 Tax=Pseudomonas putida TaxID=303 RepID=UPI003905DB8F